MRRRGRGRPQGTVTGTAAQSLAAPHGRAGRASKAGVTRLRKRSPCPCEEPRARVSSLGLQENFGAAAGETSF